jgi:hypothetical protein
MKKFFLVVPIVILLIPTMAKAQMTYQKDISPVVEARCSRCHGAGSPLVDEFKREKEKYTKGYKGPRMNSYTLLLDFVKGKDAGAIMRRLDDGKSKEDKKPGNMYFYLGKDEEERQKNLKIFKGWVGSWSLKRKAELSEEELKKITAPQ